MAKYAVNNGNLYENGSALELMVNNGSDLRIQATGTGSFQVIGKLTKNGVAKVLDLVDMSTFACKATINDNNIYAGDVSGYYSISVANATGVTKVWASIIDG